MGVSTTRHHFFVLASKEMPFFEHAAERTVFVEQFFDTPDNELLKRRCWLSQRDDDWFLKKEVLLSPSRPLFDRLSQVSIVDKCVKYELVEGTEAIVAELCRLLNKTLPPAKSAPQYYATKLVAYFTTHRTKLYPSNTSIRAPNVWIDASVFRDGRCYVVGTLDKPDGMTPSRQEIAKLFVNDLIVESPAPSKVIVYLSLYRPELLSDIDRAIAKSALDGYESACLLPSIPDYLRVVEPDHDKDEGAWTPRSEGDESDGELTSTEEKRRDAILLDIERALKLFPPGK